MSFGGHLCRDSVFLLWEKNCEMRLLDFETFGERERVCFVLTFGGFGDGVRKILRQAADQLSNKLSHAQHLDEVTWTTKNWHGLQMQRLSVVLHTAVAWQTVNELACGDSGIVHGAKCILPFLTESLRRLRWCAGDSTSTRQFAPVSSLCAVRESCCV